MSNKRDGFLTDEEFNDLKMSKKRRERMLQTLFPTEEIEGEMHMLSPDIRNMRIANEILQANDALTVNMANIRQKAQAAEDDNALKASAIEMIKYNARQVENVDISNEPTEMPDDIVFDDIKPRELEDDYSQLNVEDFVKPKD